jgi:hypothetical protein
MRDNCVEHFEATLRILQPTVVILQGRGVARWTASALPKERSISEHLYESTIGNQPAIVCSFSHPSAHGDQRWGDSLSAPYILDVIEPTLADASMELRRATQRSRRLSG